MVISSNPWLINQVLFPGLVEPETQSYSITEEDVKIPFSEILEVNVFQDPFLNEITCADPFR